MVRASIDIGTNSVLLLIADVRDGRITVLDELQEIPRLGQGVDQSGELSLAAQERVMVVLQRYKSYLEDHYRGINKEVIVTATSAVRDASNRAEFIRKITASTGWNVRLLSGDDEARVTYRGALSVLNRYTGSESIWVLDIGGGSTEIASGKGEELRDFVSLNMGSVRFTERFLGGHPLTNTNLGRAREAVKNLLHNWEGSPKDCELLVGVAGTVTSMAGIDLNLSKYEPEKMNGHSCSLEFIESMIAELSRLNFSEIEDRYPVFLKGREDVIVGGLLILSEFMKWAGMEKIMTSTGGIRHGILLEQ